MLTCIKHAPAAAEGTWCLCAEQPVDCGITVGYMKSGDFVVAFVLKARHAAEAGIDGRRDVAPLGHNPERLLACAVIRVEVKEVGGIEGIALSVERVAGVFN